MRYRHSADPALGSQLNRVPGSRDNRAWTANYRLLRTCERPWPWEWDEDGEIPDMGGKCAKDLPMARLRQEVRSCRHNLSRHPLEVNNTALATDALEGFGYKGLSLRWKHPKIVPIILQHKAEEKGVDGLLRHPRTRTITVIEAAAYHCDQSTIDPSVTRFRGANVTLLCSHYSIYERTLSLPTASAVRLFFFFLDDMPSKTLVK